MRIEERIDLMAKLGAHLLEDKDEFLKALMSRTEFNNQWFTIENQNLAIKAIAEQFLQKEKLQQWVQNYPGIEPKTPQRIGLVLAGNIPMVGFHDVLSVFMAGHQARVKLSSKDAFIMPYLFKTLGEWDERSIPYFKAQQKLEGFDAVIATGSNNSSRYFEAYFGKYPHIIRKNRNAVAVLTGEEDAAELHNLGKDIFRYFGLGCRNVAKLYVPEGYDFDPLLTALHEYRTIVMHSKYKNNFDYNYAMFILNKEPFKANGCILLREDPETTSRIANLNYEYYETLEGVPAMLAARAEQIQCVVAKDGALPTSTLPFGSAQSPGLMDYADGVDTLAFLSGLAD
ncbi:MAG: acyl-CoA reductase [Saprospiraceae bacterium]|nr:acyl-CoA reductase [Saprospiraceae bacterium]